MRNLTGGRPKKEINKKEFEALCAIQCTEKEICKVFDVSIPTLNRWCKETYNETFLNVFEQKRTVGKASVRRSQFEMAKKNPTMSIWWGKQHLGQHEPKQETDMHVSGVTVVDDVPESD